jgi:hypothetical protein
MVLATVPLGPPPLPARAVRVGGREVILVEYRGLVPEPTAEYLQALSDWERPNVEAILGTFEEVRAILGGARLLHQVLREGPLAAARGRLSFQEFMDEKADLMKQVLGLRRRINETAEKVRLILPRFPHMKEIGHAYPAHRRAS